MSREFRVLSALADSRVPVPRPFALCTDDSINDMPFYVMEYRPGLVLDTVWPEGFAHYLEQHDVKPPAEFLEHVRPRLREQEEAAEP